MFGLLHIHSLTFDGRDAEDGDVWSFRFHTNAPLTWRAGQHGLLRLPGFAVKPFTLASAPEEGSILIGTSLRSNSTYKQKLAALDEGDRVVFHGPLAHFTLDGAGADVVMLAQGIGITPFRSMLRHLTLGGDPVSATLIHVAAGHAYRQDTEADATRAYYPYHVADFRSTLVEVVCAHPEATYFIAGDGGFVKATATSLAKAGVDRNRVRRDTYYGYTPAGSRDLGSRHRPSRPRSTPDPKNASEDSRTQETTWNSKERPQSSPAQAAASGKGSLGPWPGRAPTSW